MVFREEPEGFRSAVDVVGCYVEYGGRFVLLQRHPRQSHGGKWCQPAGKIDQGESIHQAMKRELKEETGIDVPETNLKFLAPVYVTAGDKQFIFHAFSTTLAREPEIKLNPYEHVDFKWMSPHEVLQLPPDELIHDFHDTMKLFYK